MQNLNDLGIPDVGGDFRILDWGMRHELPDGEFIDVFFRDIQSKLLERIAAADFVFGSVAWLTCPALLGALAKTKGAAMVVQKEDFLRPDSNSRSDVKRLYSALPTVTRADFSGLVGGLSTHADQTVEGVRCLGNHNASKSSAFPRAHNKFAVFCRERVGPRNRLARWEPYAAWTGSFNWTKTAGHSLENAVYIHSEPVATRFYYEFQQLLALSEPLDWQSSWCEPEWRLGT